MRSYRRYRSEDDFSDDETSVISYTDSDSESEVESHLGSERECQISRTLPRGRSPSPQPSYLSGDYSDDLDEEEAPDQAIRPLSGSSCSCCESRYIPSNSAQYGSSVRNSIPVPMGLSPSHHSDTAYYSGNPEDSDSFNHYNIMKRAHRSRLGDGSGGEAWRMRRPTMGEYRGPNRIPQDLDRSYHMDRELQQRYHHGRPWDRERGATEGYHPERQREGRRYRRNSSSYSLGDLPDQNYSGERRSSNGIVRAAGKVASWMFSAISGG
ncbi:hypothetical protein BELL_0617g00070 [Botrytis elliptica]|uniref:Uncharacterized protein n=1 Tax=Botrytis elliptica TaxID=278938 RepID=A0A4Z1JIK7_9HELO|nr:hypothetical protein EAE99_004637 [Botrytis elliptica]TGO71122.1 hypothetical protein BELL_0617g00070 [Botrytis elliptica]